MTWKFSQQYLLLSSTTYLRIRAIESVEDPWYPSPSPPPPRKSIVSTIFVHLQVNFTHWRWIQSKYYSFSLELTFYLVSLLFRHQFRSMINETPRKKTSCSNFWNFSKISISHANLAIHTFTCLKWKGPL